MPHHQSSECCSIHTSGKVKAHLVLPHAQWQKSCMLLSRLCSLLLYAPFILYTFPPPLSTLVSMIHPLLHALCYIVIARGWGFMAVNHPSPRAQPEDKVGLRCHKSLATRAILNYCRIKSSIMYADPCKK